MKPILFAVALFLPLAAAHAEMSADDLIGQLRLHPGGPTRGIHAMAPAAPAPATTEPSSTPSRVSPVAARVPAKAPPATEQGQTNLTVQFQTGSDRLTPAAMRTLNVLGQALSSSDLAGDKFRIVGHTDSVGRPETNQALSERRAQAVVSYISGHFKVDPARLAAVGMGETQPLVPTAEGVPAPQNRRVQVINLGS